MEIDNNNQNSNTCFQSADQTQKYKLPSNNTSSIMQLNLNNLLSRDDIKIVNLKRKNKSSIFGSFYEHENLLKNQINKNQVSMIKRKIEKEINSKFLSKNYIKHIKKQNYIEDPFDSKKMINPKYLFDILEDFEKKIPQGQSVYLIIDIHFVVSILNLINLISGFIDNIINKEKSFKIIKLLYAKNYNYEDSLKQLVNRKLSIFENFLRIITIITSFVMFILLLIKEYKIRKYHLSIQSLNKRIIIIIICLLCYPPFINPIFIIRQKDCIYPIFIMDIFFLLNFSKIYIINILNISNSKFRTLLSHSISKNFSVKNGYFFSFRARLRDNPFFHSIFILIITFIISIFLLRSFEFGTFLYLKTYKENYEISFNSVINVFWLICMCAFGVAFGDYYPKTIISRFITIVLIFVLFLIMSFILQNIMKYTIMTESEKKVFLKMTKLYSPENIEYKAASVILLFLKLRRNKYQLKDIENNENRVLCCKKISIYILMLNRHIKNFRNNDKIADIFTIPVDDLLITVENKIHENLIHFEKSNDRLDNLQNNLEKLQDLQIKINDNISEFITQGQIIGKYIVEINNSNILKKGKKSIFKRKSSLRFSKDYTSNDQELFKNFSKNMNTSFLKYKSCKKVASLKTKYIKQSKITEKDDEFHSIDISVNESENENKIENIQEVQES